MASAFTGMCLLKKGRTVNTQCILFFIIKERL